MLGDLLSIVREKVHLSHGKYVFQSNKTSWWQLTRLSFSWFGAIVRSRIAYFACKASNGSYCCSLGANIIPHLLRCSDSLIAVAAIHDVPDGSLPIAGILLGLR